MLSAQANPGQHFWHLPIDASKHGPALDQHLLLNLWIALALLTLAHIILFAGLAFRRRASRPIHKATLEYLPLAALTILFAFLSLHAQHLWSAQRYTGASLKAMQVEVTGMQFAWYFRYPGHDATFGNTKFSLVAPGEGIEVLATRDGSATLIRKGKLLAATFHPELSDDIRVHQLFLDMVRENT